MYVATLALIIVVAMTPPGLESPTSEGPQSVPFAQWLNDLRAEALEAGISEATVETALGEITPVERVIELDRNQPEVRLDFWTYLDRIASEERIERGRRLLAENRNLLDDIAGRYGIPAPMLVAVWGIESNFGSNLGGFSVINSLATLAYDPRRATMFRRELIQALRILDEGHIGLEDMKGSWAGAMGQVQFMPSTFVDFAEDGNGDGQIDIWQSTPDALESAANFMSRSWRRGYIWGRQVQLPDGFRFEPCWSRHVDAAGCMAGAGCAPDRRDPAPVSRYRGFGYSPLRRFRTRVSRLPELPGPASLEPLALLRDRCRTSCRSDRWAGIPEQVTGERIVWNPILARRNRDSPR